MRKSVLPLICFVLVSFSLFAQNFIGAYTDQTPQSYVGFRNEIVADGFQNIINSTSYSGTIMVGGQSYPANGNISSVIIKRDPAGNLVWARSISSGHMTLISGLHCDNQNNIYVLGFFGDTLASTLLNTDPFPISNGPGIRVFVAKYSPSGQVLWSNSIPCSTSGASGSADHYAIAGDGNGNLIISAPFLNVAAQQVGPNIISPAAGSVLLAWLDSNGNFTKGGLLPGIGNTYLEIVPGMNIQGEAYISTTFRGSMTLGSAGFFATPPGELLDIVIKYDTLGSPVWANMLEAASWWGSRIRVVPDGVLMAGSFGGSIQIGSTNLVTGYHSSYLTKIDGSGNILWAKKYGESETQLYSIAASGNSIYLIGRTSNPSDTNVFDGIHLDYNDTWSSQYPSACYVLKTDSIGNALSAGYARFSFPTMNVMDACVSNSGLHITGNVGSGAVFGGILIDALQINGVNYVAHFSDSANVILGKAYYDFNANGAFDSGDAAASASLQLTGPSAVLNTIINGDYSLGVGTGTYTSLLSNPPLYYTVSQSGYTSSFGSLSMQVDSNRNFAFQPIPGQVDLMVDFASTNFRPGFSGHAWATLKNIGTTTESGTFEIMLLHPDLIIDSVSLNSTIIGDTILYNYTLLPQEQIQLLIHFHLPVIALPGSIVICFASATNPNDLTPLNNNYSVNRPVTASYDPNDKLVFPEGAVSPSFITNGNDLEYTIRFQNTGTDTAFTVLISDTLSNLLDVSSFQFIGSSHPVSLELNGHHVWFRFNQILLPDSNTNEALSHGYVRYKINVLPTAIVGTIIQNRASIYFDFNAAVVTNTTQTPIEVPLSVDAPIKNASFSVHPNPTQTGVLILNGIEGMETLSVYDISGRLILTERIRSNVLRLPVEQLSPGLYTIRVSGGWLLKTAVLEIVH